MVGLTGVASTKKLIVRLFEMLTNPNVRVQLGADIFVELPDRPQKIDNRNRCFKKEALPQTSNIFAVFQALAKSKTGIFCDETLPPQLSMNSCSGCRFSSLRPNLPVAIQSLKLQDLLSCIRVVSQECNHCFQHIRTL